MEDKNAGAEGFAHHNDRFDHESQQRYGYRTSEWEDRDDVEDTYELIIQVAWNTKLVQTFL